MIDSLEDPQGHSNHWRIGAPLPSRFETSGRSPDSGVASIESSNIESSNPPFQWATHGVPLHA
jgi:hypothetical protein